MSFSVLVALDDSPWSTSAADLGFSLAKSGSPNVTITGLHVVNVTQIQGRLLADLVGMLGFEPMIVPEQVEKQFLGLGEERLQNFERRAQEAGHPVRKLLDQGGIVNRIVHHADLHDLLIMGVRGETEMRFPGQGGGTSERVIRKLSSNSLLVTQDLTEISAICLGYDGSEGANKALRLTGHVAQIANVDVHVVYVGAAPTGKHPLDEAESVLSQLGVTTHTHRADGEAHEVLPAEAVRLGCNVLALGYRGRSKVRDIFLGRTTEWIIGRVALGLLIAR